MRTITITDAKTLRDRMLVAFETVKAAIVCGPVELTIQRPSRSREQNRKFHAMIGDIAATVDFNGAKVDAEIWKAWLIVEFERELRANGESLLHPSKVVIGLDGMTPITVRASSMDFSVKEASAFIEFLYFKAQEYGAVLSDKSLSYYEEVADRMTAA